MPTIEEVTKKYIELRDRKAEMAKRQSEEMKPLSDAMDGIESWFLSQMNMLGVDSFKTSEGTPYKSISTSVKMQDAGAFKGHVFAPASEAIVTYLESLGYGASAIDKDTVDMLLQQKARWDMVDFRAGKKGITEYIEAAGELPPGISVETTATVNVRRA